MFLCNPTFCSQFINISWLTLSNALRRSMHHAMVYSLLFRPIPISLVKSIAVITVDRP